MNILISSNTSKPIYEQITSQVKVQITDQVILRLIWLSPLAAFLTAAALFALSCRIFEKKEFT